MNDRECNTQTEVDAAIRAGDRVILRGSTSAILHGFAHAILYDSAHANLYDSANAELHDSARAILCGSASAILCGFSSAELYHSTSAILHDFASAVLYNTAYANLYDSASAELCDSAKVGLYHSARAVEGFTRRALRQSRPVVLLGPLGSRDKMLTVYQCEDGDILVRAGCFLGSRDEFAAAVAKTHPTGQYADEYRAALAMIDALAAANAVQREAA